MTADVVELRLVRLVRIARQLRERTGDAVGVQRVPWLEASAIIAWRSLPDRLLAGVDAFEALRFVGFRELGPREPSFVSPRFASALPPPPAPPVHQGFGCCRMPGWAPRPLPIVGISYDPDPSP